MKNQKLLKYFTEKVLPILDEIEFNDTEHEEYIRAQETLNQVLKKYKLKFNSHSIVTGDINNTNEQNVNTVTLKRPEIVTEPSQFQVAA